MSTTTSNGVTGGVASRLKALAPYLERMLRANGAPALRRFGSRDLTMDAWERERIGTVFAARRIVSSDDGSHLVAQGAALIEKCIADVDRLGTCDGAADEFYLAQAELMLDTAIGTALLADTQRIIDAKVRAGRLEDAKRYTEFRHKLHHLVAEVRAGISESEQAWADRQGSLMVEASPAAPAADSSGVQTLSTLDAFAAAVDAPQPRARRRRRRAVVASTSIQAAGVTSVLGLAFAAVVVAWLILVGPRAVPTRVPDAPTVEALAHGEVVRAIVSRPPSLFVDVDAEGWDALTETEKLELARSVAAAAAEGFHGALLRTSERRPLAAWHRSIGLSWIVSDELPPAPSIFRP